MRLTKFNPETGQYEYIEKAKTLDEFKAQRKAAIQRLGVLEDAQYRDNTMVGALRDIVWYNGHSEWLKELIKELEEKKKEETYRNYPNPLPTSEWHTEKHMIWMLLVGMFGDWGTSIRGGWIEQHDECIAFIKSILPEEEEDDEQR